MNWPKLPDNKKDQESALHRLSILKKKMPRYRVWGIAIDRLEPHDLEVIESVLAELEARHGLIQLGTNETHGWPDFTVRDTE